MTSEAIRFRLDPRQGRVAPYFGILTNTLGMCRVYGERDGLHQEWVETMDRDEAIRLLIGGRKGVAEWNQRRRSKDILPDLSRVDLRGADLWGQPKWG
jgi:hypothetical protein